MRRRCNNPNHNTYAHYGGRGVRVVPEWDDFVVFRDYVVANLGEPPPRSSIDRIDNNGNYAPGNIRLATAKQQARNRRSGRHITHPGTGEMLLLCEWAERLHSTPSVLLMRIKMGWPLERALSEPVDRTAGRFRSKSALRRSKRARGY